MPSTVEPHVLARRRQKYAKCLVRFEPTVGAFGCHDMVWLHDMTLKGIEPMTLCYTG